MAWELLVLSVEISSRVISGGFDIRTPFGAFSAKIPFLAPTSETLVFDQQENQIARIGLLPKKIALLGLVVIAQRELIIVRGNVEVFALADAIPKVDVYKRQE